MMGESDHIRARHTLTYYHTEFTGCVGNGSTQESMLRRSSQRCLSQTSLVLMTGDFGRTPKINNNKGRDHWPNVFSYLITGGGIPGGRVIGASDGDAAYPADNPVTPENTLASVFDMVGLDLHQLHAAGVVDDTHGVPGLFSG